MRIDIVTIFPGIFTPLEESIVGRARGAGLLEIFFRNPRDFTEDRHRKVDDRPFGGGVGMVMQPEPLARSIEAVRRDNPGAPVIACCPSGRVFDQAVAAGLAREKGLGFVCGHYEGVDERVFPLCDLSLSLGDFVITGGELAAMVMVDAVARLIPGVLPPGAAEDDSFSGGLLDWPHYTRPAEWRGQGVPEVLLSGDHARIARWRRREAESRTRQMRPDLWRRYLESSAGEGGEKERKTAGPDDGADPDRGG